MKISLSLWLALLFVWFADTSQAQKSQSLKYCNHAILTLIPNKTDWDWGKLPQGPDFTYMVKFKNTGTQPLVIRRAQSSGGSLMVYSYPKDPVMPGRIGEIELLLHTSTITYGCKPVLIYSNSRNEDKPLMLSFRYQIVDRDSIGTGK
jgi:hypothetical protein